MLQIRSKYSTNIYLIFHLLYIRHGFYQTYTLTKTSDLGYVFQINNWSYVCQSFPDSVDFFEERLAGVQRALVGSANDEDQLEGHDSLKQKKQSNWASCEFVKLFQDNKELWKVIVI